MLVAMNLPITSGDAALIVRSTDDLDTSGSIGRVTSSVALWTCQPVEESLTTEPEVSQVRFLFLAAAS
jgi:hypothetical protein